MDYHLSFKMKKIILISALAVAFILTSCYESPLGIEKNVIIIPLDSNPKPDIRTKFRADTVICEFVEKIKLNNSNDTLNVRWTPLLLDANAIIDTLGGLKLINFFINAQRAPDSIAEYRKEHVLGINLNLDSFLVENKFFSESNNNYYHSRLALQMLPSRKIEYIFGNYLFILTFRAPVYENKKLILRGRFTIDVPNAGSQLKYKYIFVGEFAIHFKLE
ncbi:hypothetical protein D9V86_02070 [Bacteroidetes/Chlorobi group bacterium ChocPot_Mid]|nr:MAG: hypothetical protein D9V86_02070 [Bacteroidetes/Chlorobi group bacterium ChocPot_Mid]